MIGILRITTAEFIKIFKKPSVYIMGLLLAVVIAVSLFVYSPTNRYTYSVNLQGATVNDLYTDWSGNAKADAKINLDAYINSSQTKLNFYSNVTLRNNTISEAVDEFVKAQKGLNEKVVNGASSPEITYAYSLVNTALAELTTAFTDDYGLESYSFYQLYKASGTYTSYYNTAAGNLGYLNILQNRISSDSATAFNSYYNANNYNQKVQSIKDSYIPAVFKSYVAKLNDLYASYNNLILTSPNSTYNVNMELYRAQMIVKLQEYQAFLTALNASPETIVLANNQEHKEITTFLNSAIDVLESVNDDADATLFERYRNTLRSYANLKVGETLTEFVNDLTIIHISEEIIETLNNFLTTKILPLQSELNAKIIAFKNENASSGITKTKAEFLSIISNYKNVAMNANSYTENVLSLHYLNGYSKSEVLQLKGYNDYNFYEVKEENAKIEFMVNTKTFDQDYSSVFSFNQNSSSETSVWDFMFYALKIASLIIVIFAIIMSSNIMAYEFDTGTIKLLAIRPYKRYKVLLGKLFSVLFFVIVFVLFSALIAFLAGFSSYPLVMTNVLAVFNASWAFAIHPVLLMVIYLLSIMLEISFYAIIAFSISTLFRSFAGAMSTSVVAYILALVLNIAFGTYLWYNFIPFMNTDFFRFFGGVFQPTNSVAMGIGNLLNVGLPSNSNFFVSLAIYAVFVGLLYFLANLVFKKRDI